MRYERRPGASYGVAKLRSLQHNLCANLVACGSEGEKRVGGVDRWFTMFEIRIHRIYLRKAITRNLAGHSIRSSLTTSLSTQACIILRSYLFRTLGMYAIKPLIAS